MRLQKAARDMRVAQPVVEKDYALSYLLAAISAESALRETLVFKGGTALKKLYFGQYRFSEDLDFTARDAPRMQELEDAVGRATREMERALMAHGPFRVEASRYRERDPHPGDQEAFTVRVRFPWYPEPLCRIKVEITHDEPLVLSPKRRALIHGYEENLAEDILCYPLAEIVAEKMRALLQTQQKLVTRGWNRPRARDYYDLWRIMRDFGPSLERVDLDDLLRKKSAHRGVTYATIADFFTAELEEEARQHWTGTLGSFVPELPACEQVLAELKELAPKHFRGLA